ncbi:PP2C family protein-serine/threonine phosphatase [Lignipirellula cremea]|nr:protein phosphatase 2C domain-containing protein [Lignipirellula cremea]
MRRSNNQDNFTVALASDEPFWQLRGHLFVVADGMGAHAAGELASKITVDTIPSLYHKFRDLPPPQALERALQEANAEVNRKGQANPDFHNMGTTCSALALLPQGAIAAHIGDSRIYRLRGDLFEQLTFDHSLVWEMRAAAKLPEGSDLAASLPKNVITRSLGPNATVKIDLEGPFPIQVGDAFLLCSDGLSGQLTDAEIGLVVSLLSPHEAAQSLIDIANLEGGPDNITVIIAKAVSPEAASPPDVKPFASSGGKVVPQPHPGVWAVFGAVAFLSVLFALLQWYPAAGVIGLAAIGILGFALYQWFQSLEGKKEPTRQRFGRGPHARVKVEPNAEFLTKIGNLVRKLRETAREMEWSIDYTDIDENLNRSASANDQGDLAAAVTAQIRALSDLMEQARRQPDKRSSDSSIDLV